MGGGQEGADNFGPALRFSPWDTLLSFIQIPSESCSSCLVGDSYRIWLDSFSVSQWEVSLSVLSSVLSDVHRLTPYSRAQLGGY